MAWKGTDEVRVPFSSETSCVARLVRTIAPNFSGWRYSEVRRQCVHFSSAIWAAFIWERTSGYIVYRTLSVGILTEFHGFASHDKFWVQCFLTIQTLFLWLQKCGWSSFLRNINIKTGLCIPQNAIKITIIYYNEQIHVAVRIRSASITVLLRCPYDNLNFPTH